MDTRRSSTMRRKDNGALGKITLDASCEVCEFLFATKHLTGARKQMAPNKHDETADGIITDHVLELASAFLDHFPADLDDDPRHLALAMTCDSHCFISQDALDKMRITTDHLEDAFYTLLLA